MLPNAYRVDVGGFVLQTRVLHVGQYAYTSVTSFAWLILTQFAPGLGQCPRLPLGGAGRFNRPSAPAGAGYRLITVSNRPGYSQSPPRLSSV